MALVWTIRQRPGDSSSMPLNGLRRRSWRAIRSPPSIEAPMKISAAMKYQKTSFSSTRSSWRGNSFSTDQVLNSVPYASMRKSVLLDAKAWRPGVVARAASRGRFVEPMIRTVFAQRVKQGDGAAEDDVSRGGHPPGEEVG